MAKRHTPATAVTKAVLYTRVSTGRQAASGLGLDAQLAACRKHAEHRGYTVTAEHTDPGVSGKDDVKKRPGLQAVLEAAAKKPDVVVVVYSLSRLSRRQSLTWKLLDDRGDYHLQIESATEPFDTSSPMGRAMLGMLGVWSQLQADMIQRTDHRRPGRRQGPRQEARRVGPLGAAPRDRCPGPRPLRDREVFDRCTGRWCNRLKLPTARPGSRWHATTVARLVKENQP